MSKKYGHWRGRPNEPPLNWEAPHKPVVRRVGRLRFTPDQQSTSSKNESQTISTTISMPSQQWIAILKALHLYRHFHDDQVSEAWRIRIRERILGVIDEKEPESHFSISLNTSDWGTILRRLHKVAEWKGGKWLNWEQKMSQYISQHFRE